MFRDWDGFYLIVGSAAGALIGLMFVVVTLTAAGLASSRRPSHGSDIYLTASKVYLTPIVFHFAIVMIISAISAVPNLPPRATDAALTLCAAIGLVYSVTTTIRTLRLGEDFPPPHWSDKWFYGILPAIAYLVLFAGAAGEAWLTPRNAGYVVGATSLGLLLIGIRNAWDLATFLVRWSPDQPR